MERYTTRGLLTKIASAFEDEDVNPNLTQVTRADIVRVGEQALNAFRQKFITLLSCYNLTGEFGLSETLKAYVQSKAPNAAAIEAAVVAGDQEALYEAFLRASCLAFIQLAEKNNSLKRLQLVDPLPAEALAEYAAMRQFANPPAPAATAFDNAADDTVVRLTPEEKCSNDFRKMSSAEFKATWLGNNQLRAIVDRCVEQGRI